MNELSVEHIDPRNGVLVSGLENNLNEVIADYSYNSRKVNRFVPYRVCEYPAPVNEGDVGEFLIGGEWVVCEFMTENSGWWQESNCVGNSQVDGGKVAGTNAVINKKGLFSPGSKQSVLEGARKGGGTSGGRVAKPVMCVETGIVYTSAHEASRQTGISRRCISYCCRGQQKTTGGYRWKFT